MHRHTAGEEHQVLDISLLYIGVIIVLVAFGFAFALRIAMAAALDADRRWTMLAAEAGPAAVGAHADPGA